MNRYESDILLEIKKNSYTNQRTLAEHSGHSVGIVNRCLNALEADGYLSETKQLTEKTTTLLEHNKPQRAILLAAGYGMRMVPINLCCSKGLLEVNGEPLIERTIKQLQEVGIKEIYIVVGFMKEQYEYLMDKYGVNLLVNNEYASKNNLHSLCIAKEYLCNSYIVPCDIWCKDNPYSEVELYAWYMVSDMVEEDSNVRVNRKLELSTIPQNTPGNAMIGISYISDEIAEKLQKHLEKMDGDRMYSNAFWEEALLEKDRICVNARVVMQGDVVEINTYEQLRELDDNSNHLQSEALNIIASVFDVDNKDIVNISVLKKGMTNRSFIFTIDNQKYIMRIPGEGTDQLINRREEAAVYHIIKDKEVCDDIVYINPDNGYKITRYMENARNCDQKNVADLNKCMKKLREFHGMKLKVNHTFDLFQQIEFYETLWKGVPSVYRDYQTTKENVYHLKEYINWLKPEYVLTHIDAVPDNFLFSEENGEEQLRLIDWEYAAMQDPHVDIAMFCIYAMYDRQEIDQLIDIYFEGHCNQKNRVKIYCYIAICGLLWSNWCEYKRSLGVEFGEYSLKQYRYAKEYYRIAVDEMNRMGEYRNV